MKKIITAMILALSIVLTMMLSSCQYIPEEILDMIGLGGEKPDGEGEKESVGDGESEPEDEPEEEQTPEEEPGNEEKMPNSADELYETATAETEKQTSYESEISMSMVIYVEGVKFEVTTEGKIIASDDVDGDAYYYSRFNNTTRAAATDYTSSGATTTAYYGGKAFVMNESDDAKQAFYSECTADEFTDKYFGDNGTAIFDPDYNNCTVKAFRKIEDGWSLYYSGYTASAINELSELLGLDDLEMEEKVEDANVVVTVDENYIVTEISLMLVFEDGDASPSIEYTQTFSHYGSATPVLDELAVENYTEIPDIFILGGIEDMLDERSNAKSGAFTLDIVTSVLLMGNTTTSIERDEVEYGSGSFGFYYDIILTSGDQYIEIGYSNGTLSVGDESVMKPVKEAREDIEGLINSAKYNASDVINVTKLTDTEYRFDLDVSENASYIQIATNANTSFVSAEQVIIYTIVDGAITDIDSSVCIKSKYIRGTIVYDVEITIDTLVDFKDAV